MGFDWVCSGSVEVVNMKRLEHTDGLKDPGKFSIRKVQLIL